MAKSNLNKAENVSDGLQSTQMQKITRRKFLHNRELFTRSFSDMLKNKEKQSWLRKKFLKDRVIVIDDFLTKEGVSKLRKDFDKLKEKETKNVAKHKNIYGVDAQLVEKQEFVKFLMESEEFRNFLREMTGFDRLRIRSKKKANINISSEAGQNYEWHFDGEGITVIFPLDGPKKENGGAFAYYPMYRRHNAGIINKSLTKAFYMLKLHRVFLKEHRIYYRPGTLVVFDGDTTYHCAMPLTGKDYRRIVILHYVKR